MGWLEREYAEDDFGFWSNRNIIAGSFDKGDLWVIRDDGGAVAYQVGDHSPDIANVRKERRREGFGTSLFEATLARAMRDDVNVLEGECSPADSLPFWEKHGFVRCADFFGGGRIMVRRILQRSFGLPDGLPRVEVVVAFYPEAAAHADGVAPLAEHRVTGARRADGVIQLERRVVGVREHPDDRDLVVKVAVDRQVSCFCKARYDDAGAVGVIHDWRVGAFYVDAVKPQPS